MLDDVTIIVSEAEALEIKAAQLLKRAQELRAIHSTPDRRGEPEIRDRVRRADRAQCHRHPHYGHRTKPLTRDNLPTTWRALITRYVEQRKEPFTQSDIMDVLARDGYNPKTSTVASNILRMKEAGKIAVVSWDHQDGTCHGRAVYDLV